MLSNELIKFSDGKTDFYEAAVAYFCDKQQSQENKNLLDMAFFSEIERKSGVSREGLDSMAWASNPSVQWAYFAVRDAVIDAIIPTTILPQFGIFADFRTQAPGDITKFTIKPNSFYTVSLSANGERTTHRQKKYNTDLIVAPIDHIITVYTDWFRVMSGKESPTDMFTLVVRSLENAMYDDALGALMTGLESIPVGAQNVTGAFDMKTLVQMCETVQYRNSGVRPIICGSATALMNVIPDSTSGYRLNVDGEGNGRIELLKSIMGYTVMKLDNAVSPAGKLILPDNKVFVVSPSQDKLIKGVMTAGFQNGNQFFDNADLTSNQTYHRAFNFVYASAAHAGVYNIDA